MSFQPSELSFAGTSPPNEEYRLVQEIRHLRSLRTKQRKGSPKYHRYTMAIRKLEAALAKLRPPGSPMHKLQGHIRDVKKRIVKIKKAIRSCKQKIAAAMVGTALTGGALAPGVAALTVHLHKMEKALHHNRHLLTQLLKLRKQGAKASPKALAAVVSVASKTAAAPVEAPPAAAAAADPAYPANPAPAPEAKPVEQVIEEAKAEAADSSGKAAEAHDDAAAGAKSAEEPKDDHDLKVSAEVDADTNVSLLKKPLFWVGVTGIVLYTQRKKIAAMMPTGA